MTDGGSGASTGVHPITNNPILDGIDIDHVQMDCI